MKKRGSVGCHGMQHDATHGWLHGFILWLHPLLKQPSFDQDMVTLA